MLIRRRTGFGCDRRGNILMTAALIAPVLITLAGGSVDYARSRYEHRRMQDAIDAAVLAGVAARDGQQVEVAEAVYAANEGPEGANVVFSLDGDDVLAVADFSVPTSFLSAVGIRTLPIRVNARASMAPGYPACVILLEQTNVAFFAKSSSEMTGVACGVHVNSTSDYALTMESSSELTADSLCLRVATLGVVPSADINVDSQSTSCPSLPDPLSGLTAPEAVDCAPRSYDKKNPPALAPGCHSSLYVKSSVSLDLAPGEHVITGLVTLDGDLSGDDVVLILKGPDARVVVNNSADVDLSARTSGAFKGVVILQDRHMGAPATALDLNSSSDINLDGAIYLPKSELQLNSSSTLNAPLLIVKTLDLHSSSEVTADPSEATTALPKDWRRLAGVWLSQ